MDALRTWYHKWDHIPWKHWNSLEHQWNVLPTFLVGEYFFFALTLLTLLHATRQGRQHLFVWLASFLAGSANDIFFMYLPLVDNFWQSQATVMLTPRLPLYIPCVYNIFMYCSTVTVWRLGLPRLAEACLTGLLGELIYSPYDITGIKFLWWTWHDTDPPIDARLLGAPIGSSLWVITFTATFAFLVRTVYLNWNRSVLLSVLVLCLFSTPVMMIQMAVLQLVSFDKQGVPTENSLFVGILLYLAVVLYQFRHRNLLKHSMGPKIKRHGDLLLNVGLLAHFAVFIGIMLVADPQEQVSTGIHQTYGPCGVKQKDFSGQIRHKYVCSKEMDEDWDFSCSKVPYDMSEWYTVCGKSHSNAKLWLGAVVALGVLGSSTYSSILKFGRRRPRPHSE